MNGTNTICESMTQFQQQIGIMIMYITLNIKQLSQDIPDSLYAKACQ